MQADRLSEELRTLKGSRQHALCKIVVAMSFSGRTVGRKQVVFIVRCPADPLTTPDSDSYLYHLCVAVVMDRHSVAQLRRGTGI